MDKDEIIDRIGEHADAIAVLIGRLDQYVSETGDDDTDRAVGTLEALHEIASHAGYMPPPAQ